MFVTGESPTEQDLIDVDGRHRVRSRAEPGASLLESRLCAARTGRRGGVRDGVHGVRRQPDHRPARARPHDVAAAAAGRAGLPRRRVRAHRMASSRRPISKGERLPPASCGRPSRDLGRWASFLATGQDDVLAAENRGGDVVPAGDVGPRGLGARLGSRADALQPRRPDLRRSRWCHGRPPLGRLRRPQDADRRCRTHQLDDARRHGVRRDQARREDDRALARAHRALAARG